MSDWWIHLYCGIFVGAAWVALWRIGEFFHVATKTLKGELPLNTHTTVIHKRGEE